MQWPPHLRHLKGLQPTPTPILPLAQKVPPAGGAGGILLFCFILNNIQTWRLKVWLGLVTPRPQTPFLNPRPSVLPPEGRGSAGPPSPPQWSAQSHLVGQRFSGKWRPPVRGRGVIRWPFCLHSSSESFGWLVKAIKAAALRFPECVCAACC